MQSNNAVFPADLQHPDAIARARGSLWTVIPEKWRGHRREKRQNCGCRVIPSLFLSNARSITHKIGELEPLLASNNTIRNCNTMIFTETWLYSSIPDTTVELTDRTLHRQDRSSDTGKSTGGGLSVYVNNNWCTLSHAVDSPCSRDLEPLSVLSRPFHLPRELTVFIPTAVYIAPDANVSSPLVRLHQIISKQQKNHTDGVHVTASDFNQASRSGHHPPSSEISNNHPCPKETVLKQPSRLQTCGPHPSHNEVF